MARRYLLLSDLHLCDVEDHADGWMAYKQRRFFADDELARVINHFVHRGALDDERVLVLNGDIIDFDLITKVPDDPPWPVTGRERKRGLLPTEPKSVWKLQQALADHPVFVDALTRFLAAGHRIVYVIGNHDPEMHFPGTQQELVHTLRRRGEELGLSFDEAMFSFEPWFYYEPGEVYVEHGQQYDFYTSFRYVLSPYVKTMGGKSKQIALPMGNLSNRYLMSQMGFFNPHASDYILNVFRYLAHWFRFYAFSLKRHIAINWFLGSMLVMSRLFAAKGHLKRDPPDHETLLAVHAEKKGIPKQQIQALDCLKQLPITHRIFRLMRELWIDRLIMALLMTGGTIALALVPIPLWIKLMVPLSSFPLLYFIYEWVAHSDGIFAIEGELPKMARRVARVLPAKVLVFGHTHVPEIQPVAEGVTYANTGTWAPTWAPKDKDLLVPGYRNALWLTFDDDGEQRELRLESHLPLDKAGRRRPREGAPPTAMMKP